MICSEWAALTHVHGSNESFEMVRFVPVPSFVVVCVCVYVHTHVQQSLLSTVFFHTMTAHSNPIKVTQRASRHHSFNCHSFPPPPSSSSAACGWLGGNGVGELYHFLVLSLCLLLFIPPVVRWHLGVNMFHLAWCQNVYSEKSTRVVLRLDWRSSWNVILDFSLNLTIAFKSST